MSKASKQEIRKFNSLSYQERFQLFYDYRYYALRVIEQSGVCKYIYKEPHDILQEVYSKLWIYIKDVDIEKSNITTYLKMIVDSCIKNTYRDAKRANRCSKSDDSYVSIISIDDEKEDDLTIQLKSAYESDDPMADLERDTMVSSILTERERGIYYRRFVEGKNYSTIAKEDSISTERVRQLVHKVMGKIKDAYEKDRRYHVNV